MLTSFILFQGSLLAGVSILEKIMTVLGSFVFTTIYSETLDVFPGITFYVMGTTFGVAAILMM